MSGGLAQGPVGCAVIGLGWMGRLHAAFLAASPLADLHVCCDLHAGAAAHCPSGSRFTSSLESVLDDGSIEAVFVCTPPDSHRVPVELALQAGRHVFCEKPLATTLEDAAGMASAPGARDRLVVGHIRRFDPRFLTVRDSIESGRIGRPLHLVGGVNCPREDAHRLGSRVSLALESAVHDIDVMRWFAGDVTRVYAEGSRLTTGSLVGALVATLRFSSGVVGCLHHSWVLADDSGLDWEFHFQVNGENGLLDIDGRHRGVTIHGPGGVVYPDVYTWPSVHGSIGGVLAIEDACFLERVRGGRAWPLDLDDALEAVSVAIDIDRSIAEERIIARSRSGDRRVSRAPA